jgi:hypothetical protein
MLNKFRFAYGKLGYAKLSYVRQNEVENMESYRN